MADKVVSGIGRELRYFEYKLRKKNQTSKKDKKNKNGHPSGELAWSDAPTSDEFRTPTSEELRKAMPSNKGEEELQIQVALAMSREEEHERSRQTQSDDLRLKLAMEESKMDSIPKPTAPQSLLDLSMNQPKPTAPVQSPGIAGVDLFGSTATNDPWGGGAVAAPAAPATFDPFASSAPVGVTSAPYPTATASSAWGPPQTSAPAPVAPQDPWGGGQNLNPPSNSFPAAQPNPWAAAPTQNAFPTQSNGAWGSPDPFANAQPTPTFDPFLGTAATTPQSQSNGFGTTAPMAPTAQARPVDPFASATPTLPPQSQVNAFGMPVSSASTTQAPVVDPFGMTGSSTTFSAPPFDPLKDFDQLHISATNGYNEPDPVVLQNDLSAGKSIAKDIFPLGQVLEPMPVTAKSVAPEAAMPVTRKKETDVFLGENSNLVNLDSGWKTYQVPFCSKPLGTQAHNPFQQSGPTKTLNEMKNTKQPGFS